MAWLGDHLLELYLAVGVVAGASVWASEVMSAHPQPSAGRALQALLGWPWLLAVACGLLARRAVSRSRDARLQLADRDARVQAAARLLHETILQSCPASQDRAVAVERLSEAHRAARAAIYAPRP